MKKAEINIEVLADGSILSCNSEVQGEIWALMVGLTNAIKAIEERVPEECRATYRTRVLALLNNRR